MLESCWRGANQRYQYTIKLSIICETFLQRLLCFIHSRYLEKFDDFKLIDDDGYIYWHLISHMIQAGGDNIQLAVDLMKDFVWLEKCLKYTSPVSVIVTFKALKAALSHIKDEV